MCKRLPLQSCQSQAACQASVTVCTLIPKVLAKFIRDGDAQETTAHMQWLRGGATLLLAHSCTQTHLTAGNPLRLCGGSKAT